MSSVPAPNTRRSIRSSIRAQASGATTAAALVEKALNAAAGIADRNAIAEMQAALALETARALDAKRLAGAPMGPLHGIPVTIKDMYRAEGFTMRGGTGAALPDLGPGDFVAVARLRAAGAVILAMTNMHEVALGLTGENPVTGDVRNFHDPARQAGGSSSGAGVAVVAGIGFAALGSDTGGSIRVPASSNGVCGFKPTHGLVPMAGALPLSATCDHAGPIAGNADDLRIVAEVLADRPLTASVPTAPRFGVPRAYLEGRLSPGVRTAFEQAIDGLHETGAAVDDVDCEALGLTLDTYPALARYEFVRVYEHRPLDGFSPALRAAIASALLITEDEYAASLVNRQRMIDGFAAAMRGIDAMLLPATPAIPPLRGTTIVALESGETPHRTAQLALTAPFNLTGTPVAVVPFAWSEAMPLGLQIAGARDADALTLALAGWVERAVSFR